MSIEKKACEAYEENQNRKQKYQIEDEAWMDWFALGYNRGAKDTKEILSEEQCDEKMVELIKSAEFESKLKLGHYVLVSISERAIEANSDKTTLSAEFDHNGQKYKAEMLITQKEI